MLHFLLLPALMASPASPAERPSLALCPLGTMVTMERVTASEQRGAGRVGFRPAATVHLRVVGKPCALMVEDFYWNTPVARLAGDTFVAFRSANAPAPIRATSELIENGSTYDPAYSIKHKRRCNPAAIDSTIFGSSGSCAGLVYRGGPLLRLRYGAGARRKGQRDVPLPGKARYVGLTAGDWAHDVGGELALIRPSVGASVTIDIFTLLDS